MSRVPSLQYLSYKALPNKLYKQQLSSYIKGQAHKELVSEIISQKQKSTRDNKETKDNLIKYFRDYFKDDAFQFLVDSPLPAFFELKVGKNREIQDIYLLSKFYTTTLKDFINFMYNKYDESEQEEWYFHLPPKNPINTKSERIMKIIQIFKLLNIQLQTTLTDSLLTFFNDNLSLLLKNLDLSFLKEYKNYLEQFN